MAVVEEQIVIADEWRGLYSESWKGVIADEAFAHPAKFSRALIRRIYDHVIEEGWATKGSSVVDPFGGVALGALDAMRHGLNWYGCELEAKFVGLGGQNIALWNERFSRMPNWGTARLIQGDSRKLVEVLSAVGTCVSSPPYADGCRQTGGEDPKPHYIQSGNKDVLREYGETAGQLGAMKEGDHSIAIGSPPYLNGEKGHPSLGSVNNDDWGHDGRDITRRRGKTGEYGKTEGQLGAMPEGQLCVTSPPYNPPMSQDHNGTRGGQRGTTPSEKGAFVKYGNSEGQLEGMSMEGHAIAVSSPPFENSINREGEWNKSLDPKKNSHPQNRSTKYTESNSELYGQSEGQLGIERGETFWSASRLILEQLHQVIVPGGHAVFVVKAFVRDKKIVDFPGQWAQLCEAVGFRLLHDHHALLVEAGARQPAMDEFDIQGDTWRIVTRDRDYTVARKSFFRRLAEQKGSPRIDYENVLCFQKVG